MTLFTPEQELLLAVSLPVKPKAKERPRSTKGGVFYTPPATKAAEKALADMFHDVVGDGFEPFDRPIDVRWQFHNEGHYLEVWSAEDYKERKLRGDTDNYLKTGGDALNKIAWTDDRLIVKVSGEKL